jgi:DNA-binding XRE family transcriptional regulator
MKPKNNESNAPAQDAPAKSYLAEKCSTFGDNMRIARKERGFTSEALGRFLGISTAYVGLIERGERCPSLETFLKICDFFGESYEAMFIPKGTLSVKEKKAAAGSASEKSQVARKQRMIAGMLSTFDAEELDHIIGVIKSFKNFSHKVRVNYQDTEAAEEVSFSSDDVIDLA